MEVWGEEEGNKKKLTIDTGEVQAGEGKQSFLCGVHPEGDDIKGNAGGVKNCTSGARP